MKARYQFIVLAYKKWNEAGLFFLIGGVDWEQYDRFMSGSTAVQAKGFTHVEPNGIMDNQRFELDVPPLFKYPSKLINSLHTAWQNSEYFFARELSPGMGLFWQSNMDCEHLGFKKVGHDLAEGTVMAYGEIEMDNWKHVSIVEHELRKHAFDTASYMQKYAPGFHNSYIHTMRCNG